MLRVFGSSQLVGEIRYGVILGLGVGDNAVVVFGFDIGFGDVVVSLGMLGVVCLVSNETLFDGSGVVVGFADAIGCQLPLVCTLNAVWVLDAMVQMLGVDLIRLS